MTNQDLNIYKGWSKRDTEISNRDCPKWNDVSQTSVKYTVKPMQPLLVIPFDSSVHRDILHLQDLPAGLSLLP